MLQVLQVASLLLIAAAWALALAHAAEMPGKRRLDRATYLAVQGIYYPGFTIGGATEPLAIVALSALAIATGVDDPTFPCIAVALVGAIGGQAVYWLMTHPINKVWVKAQSMGGAGSAFFGAGETAGPAPWTSYRDRWDHSHLIRAALFTAALVALTLTLVE